LYARKRGSEEAGTNLKILVKTNKKLILAKNVYWTFGLLLLPSSAKIKKGVLLDITYWGGMLSNQ